MKNYSIFLLLLISAIKLHAQVCQISFAGTGASTTVDSVKVENLTQGISLSIGGSETLNLVKTITGINQSLDYKNTFRIYPNPITDNSTIEFVATTSGTVTIELFETNGKRVGKVQCTLTIGTHLFNISGLCRGIYTVRINSNTFSYTGKLISIGEPGSAVKINYNGYSDIKFTSSTLKSANDEKAIQYTTGDILKMTGKSGNYSTICTDIPVQNQTIIFTFVACTDADGNNYPVVQIGTQLWMAENLNTTKYSNGDSISFIADGNKWRELSTGACCDYDNNTEISITYGKLYNGYAVVDNRNIAPTGWHVATDEEWTTLENYVSSNPGCSGSLAKALASTTNWSSNSTPNWSPYIMEGAILKDLTKNNSTGFTALPGGYRYDFGAFANFGWSGYWWCLSPDEENTSIVWMGFQDDSVGRSYGSDEKVGGSVRCVKD